MAQFNLEFRGFPKKDDPKEELKACPARASPDVFKKTLGEVYTYFFNMCEPGQNWGSCALVLKADYNPARPDLINNPERPYGGDAKNIVEDYVLYGKVDLVGSRRTRALVCRELKRVFKQNPEPLNAIADALRREMPNEAWTILQGFYDDSHLNRENWAKAMSRFLSKWDVNKSLSLYVPVFNNAVQRLNDLAPEIPDKQAPNVDACRRQFLVNTTLCTNDDFKILRSNLENNLKNVPLHEVQQRLIEVDPVSKKATEVNHNVAEASVSAAEVVEKSSLIKGPSGVYYNISYPGKLVAKMTQVEKDDLLGAKGKSGQRVSVKKAEEMSNAAKTWLSQLKQRSFPWRRRRWPWRRSPSWSQQSWWPRRWK